MKFVTSPEDQPSVVGVREHLGLCLVSLSGTCEAGAELPWNGRELITKVGEQPWPQLVRCASIDCRACGCVFQED